MAFSSMSNSPSNLGEQTIGRFLPSSVDCLPFVGRRPVIPENHPGGSCPTDPPESTTERTVFRRRGCVVYGYPSTGGVLIKEADLVDLLSLSLSRFQVSQHSASVEEEDKFCNLLRRTGATWWPSKREQMEVHVGAREMTEEEKKVLVFGWPADGVGVWVLRYASERDVPRDFGRVSFAISMEERIQIMREYGATLVEDVAQVEELHDTF